MAKAMARAPIVWLLREGPNSMMNGMDPVPDFREAQAKTMQSELICAGMSVTASLESSPVLRLKWETGLGQTQNCVEKNGRDGVRSSFPKWGAAVGDRGPSDVMGPPNLQQWHHFQRQLLPVTSFLTSVLLFNHQTDRIQQKHWISSNSTMFDVQHFTSRSRLHSLPLFPPLPPWSSPASVSLPRPRVVVVDRVLLRTLRPPLPLLVAVPHGQVRGRADMAFIIPAFHGGHENGLGRLPIA